MTEHFSCRNNHRWALSLEGAMLNERWLYCPACGAPPRPASPVTALQRCRSWMRRNPGSLTLAASILVMAATIAVMLTTQWGQGQARQTETRQRDIQALQDAIDSFQSNPHKERLRP
jgi:hypothetical protein